MNNVFLFDVVGAEHDFQRCLPLSLEEYSMVSDFVNEDGVKRYFTFEINFDMKERIALAGSYAFLLKLIGSIDEGLSLFWNHAPVQISCDPNESFGQFAKQIKDILTTKASDDREHKQIQDSIMCIKFDTRFCTLEGCKSTFDQVKIYTIGQRLRLFIEQLSLDDQSVDKNISQPLYNLSIILPQEQTLLHSLINGEMNYGTHKNSLHEEFTYLALVHPQKLAVILDDQSLTYAELLDSAQHLALSLISNYKIQNGQIVCQYMDRSLEMFIGIFGILMAGGIYCPVLAQDPLQRVMALTEQVKVTHILVHSHTLNSFDNNKLSELTVIDVTTCLNAFHDKMSLHCDSNINIDKIAAVIFTSGSTGQ